MSEIFEPTPESSTKKAYASGVRAKRKAIGTGTTRTGQDVLNITRGSILRSVLIGYSLSRMEDESRRQRLMEDWMQEATIGSDSTVGR